MERLKMQTPNMAEEYFKKLKELFPEAVTEVEVDGVIKPAIDKDVLQQLISNEVVEGPKERYQFTWPGKHEAMLLAGKPTNKTLRPVKGENPIDDACFNNTENLYIEGDNLEVLKILETKYAGKIKMIYIDPPYNTGNDFIYKDKFDTSKQEYLEDNGERDNEGNRLVKNMESNGRFHSDWLSMMYPRLIKARNLLSDDGLIFISIDDNEQENLKKICDEIFGINSFINTFVWQKNSSEKTDSSQFTVNTEYVFLYSKTNNYNLNNAYKPLSDASQKLYKFDDNDGRGKYQTVSLQKPKDPGPETTYDYIDNTGKIWKCPPKGWRMKYEKIKNLENDNRLVLTGNTLRVKDYWNERTNEGKRIDTLWNDLPQNTAGSNELNILMEVIDIFDNPKPVKLIKRCVEIGSSKDSIILDFFSGSATTAHAVMQLNAEDSGHRKFIMVQLPEPSDEKSEAYRAGYRNICEIGKERIRRAGKKILEEYKNTPFCKGGCQAKPDRGIFDYNAEVETTEREKISPSALQAATPLYERGSLGNASINNNDNSNILNKVPSNAVSPLRHIRDTSPNFQFGEDLQEKQEAPLTGELSAKPTEGAAHKVSGEGADCRSQSVDIGFRVLRLDSSNMKDVFYRPRDLKKDDLLSYTSNIKEDRTDLDLLFQAMPEIAGADYDAKIDEITISNKKVFKVNNNYIVACFEESINEEVIREIAKLKPYHAIFRDSSFPNDSLLANLEQIFRIESPDTEITVL